jgi:cell division septal protein FtsQ
MRPINVQKIRQHDRFARRKRKLFIAKMIAIGIGAASFFGGILYFFLFSSSLEIQQINVSGLKKVDAKAIDGRIQEQLQRTWLTYVRPQKNIFLFDSDRLRSSLLDQFPELKDVTIEKDPMHVVAFTFVEREPLGIWCFKNDCRYFDDEGALWGQPVRSSGFLLLTVNDLRERDQIIDEEFLEAVKQVHKGFQGIHVGLKNIRIPADRLREFQADTSKGYPVLISLDSDLAKQMEVFRIFIEKKATDKTFHPQYVDLRIDGRIYYKPS